MAKKLKRKEKKKIKYENFDDILEDIKSIEENTVNKVKVRSESKLI